MTEFALEALDLAALPLLARVRRRDLAGRRHRQRPRGAGVREGPGHARLRDGPHQEVDRRRLRPAAVLPPRLRRRRLGRRLDRHRRCRERRAQNLFADEKTRLEWNATRALLPKNKVKLILNLVLLAGQAIPRGGIISVDLEGHDNDMTFTVTAKGTNAKLQSHWPHLLAAEPEVSVDAHRHPGLLHRPRRQGGASRADGLAGRRLGGVQGRARRQRHAGLRHRHDRRRRQGGLGFQYSGPPGWHCALSRRATNDPRANFSPLWIGIGPRGSSISSLTKLRQLPSRSSRKAEQRVPWARAGARHASSTTAAIQAECDRNKEALPQAMSRVRLMAN